MTKNRKNSIEGHLRLIDSYVASGRAGNAEYAQMQLTFIKQAIEAVRRELARDD
jgi:hypothetical protein